jgi:uncharacterized protein (DUF2141 family)
MHKQRLSSAILVLGLSVAPPGWAAELVVEVSGVRSDRGRVGCALFAAEAGFPMETAVARLDWQPARPAGTTCRFTGLAPGLYALAVSHDLNGNGKTDTNFLGIPTEDWGVSNNVRPSMRAPRFKEAAFQVGDGTTRIAVGVAP